MSSTTCNCVGLGRHDEKTHTRRMYVAQNRAEIMQMRHEAKQDGDAILVWYAQTPAGVRVLGPACPEENAHVMDSFVPSVPMVTCPYCHGRGRNGNHYCPVCRGSGLMKPGHDKRWQQWQLDSMKAEADEADGDSMKRERTQAERAVAHSRQVAKHPWSDAEVVASLYDESDDAVSHNTEKTRDTDEEYVRVLYKDGSQAWVTWDSHGTMHFHIARRTA